MRTKLLVASLVTFSLLLSTMLMGRPAYAASGFDTVCTTGSGSSSSTVCKSKDSNTNPVVGPNGIITKVITLMSIAISVGAVLVIIISGIRFVVSGGDPNSVASAKNAILYAVVALVVAALAQSIVIFVVNKL